MLANVPQKLLKRSVVAQKTQMIAARDMPAQRKNAVQGNFRQRFPMIASA
jgi:hypothetical protein